MDAYTNKPFLEAVRELLQERGTDKWGRPQVAWLTREIAARAEVTVPYVRLVLGEQRPIQTRLIEAAAEVFNIDPRYFVEYRTFALCEAMRQDVDFTNEVHRLHERFTKRQRGVATP